jgi:TM2 domain-containing membrane protein YozV
MKDKNVAAILALFLGGLGVHKFYLGRIGTGVLYLVFCLTFVPWLLGLIDFFVLALMDSDEFHRRFNGSRDLPAPVIVNMLPPGPGYAPGGYPQGGYPQQGGYPGPQYGYGAGGWGQPGSGSPGYGTGQLAPPPGPSHATPLSPDQLTVQLEKLNELRISGILTEDEFQSQKSKLLDRM